MTVFVIISLFVCIGLELLSRARQNVDAIKETFWQDVQSSLHDVQEEMLSEETVYDTQLNGRTSTEQLRKRRSFILHTYSEQMDDDVHEPPVREFGRLPDSARP